MSYVGDYFKLSSEQKSQVKAEFNQSLAKIEKEDFSVYMDRLDHLSHLLDKGVLSDQDIRIFLDDAENNLKKSMQKFEPWMQRLMDLQAKTDFERFDQEFMDKQNKDLDKAQDPKRIVKEQKKKFLRWVGETIEYLSEDQERQLNEFLLENPPPLKLQVESRQAIFEKFKSHRQDSRERQKIVRSFFYDWESLQTPSYLQAQKAYREKFKDFLVKLGVGLSQKQRDHFVKNLRKRSLELKTLSER